RFTTLMPSGSASRRRTMGVRYVAFVVERQLHAAGVFDHYDKWSRCRIFWTRRAMSEQSNVNNAPLAEVDPEIAEVLGLELGRQRGSLEMIASENFVPRAILETQGSVLTNKYAEGYPGRRYYGGCEHVDVAENLAIERAKTLFGAEYANVQPHAGAQANVAVMEALMEH